jgi:hypothetical protein
MTYCFGLLSRLIIAMVIGTVQVKSYAGVENRQYEVQKNQLAIQIELSLVEQGHCRSSAECRARKLLTVNPGKVGLDVRIYSLKPGPLINSIIKLCLEMYLKNDQKMEIAINAYETSKEEELVLKFWQSSNPFFSATFVENK